MPPMTNHPAVARDATDLDEANDDGEAATGHQIGGGKDLTTDPDTIWHSRAPVARIWQPIRSSFGNPGRSSSSEYRSPWRNHGTPW